MKIFDPEFTGSIQFLTEVQGGFTGSLFGTASWAQNVSTASYVQTAQTASYFTASNLVGDIILGTQTSGQYVATVSQGTGVTVTGGTGEGSTAQIAIGQAVGTTSNVQFNQITASIVSASFTGSLLGTASRASSITSLTQNVEVTGDVRITGSLVVKDNLTVLGTSSIVYVTSSQLDISTNIITLNTETNTIRFGGLAVIDSGSSPRQSGSILYDSVQDEWIFVHRGASNIVTSSHFLVGPETYNNLGNEIYIPDGTVLKGSGNEHITASKITDDGTTITLGGITNITNNARITGSLIVSASSNVTEFTVIGQSILSGGLWITASDAITSVGNIITTGSLFISASQGNTIVISAVGNTVITGSLIVSGTGGAGVFSKGGNYVDLVNGVPAFTSSLYVWRAPFTCQMVSLYANKSGSSNVTVNARKKSGASFTYHTTSLVLSTNDSWTAANSVLNTSYAIGDSLEFVITGSFFQCAIQADFIKT